MTKVDYLAHAAAAAERGEADLHVWAFSDGEIMDWTTTNPGVVVADGGHASRLSQLSGEEVRFAGRVFISDRAEQLKQLTQGDK